MEVYNPWSIINYIDNKKLKSYWINTSGNLLIKSLLMKSTGKVFDELQKLVEGKSKVVFINESIAMGNNLAPNSLWELLLFSGYLTIEEQIDERTCKVRIPNNEVRSFFKTLFVDILFTSECRNIGELKQPLIIKDYEGILDLIRDLILKGLNSRYPSYIFEFKRSDEEHLEADAKKAYEQIEDKKYDTILTREEIKNIVKIGLAFDGKRVEGYYEG